MTNSKPETHDRIQVGGIKLSPELVQFTFSPGPVGDSSLTIILALVAGRRINLPFFTLAVADNERHASFCVASEHLFTVQQLIRETLPDDRQPVCIPSVGSLTLFPHRNSISLLGKIVSLFAGTRLPIYGLATSISALTINTDYRSLEKATDQLTTILELPPNHSPFRHEFDVQQIAP